MKESTTIQQQSKKKKQKTKKLKWINRKHSYLFYIPHGFNRFFSLLDVFIWQTLFSFWQTISQSKQRRKKTSALASNTASINWLYSSCFEKRLFQYAMSFYAYEKGRWGKSCWCFLYQFKKRNKEKRNESSLLCIVYDISTNE